MSTEPAASIDSNAVASAEQRARRRLVAEKGFYVHLVTYVTVISGLFIINALTDPAGGGLSGLPSDGVSASPSTHCPLSA